MDDAAGLWTALGAANRWLLYGAMLLAAGSALFLAQVKVSGDIAAAAARAGRRAAMVCILAFILSLGFGGAEMMMGGAAALFDPRTWTLAASTTLGKSAFFGIPALMALILALSSHKPLWMLMAAFLALASFLFTGHAVTAPPAWLARTAVMTHLVCAAFWLGAFYPLLLTVRRAPAADAGDVMAQFSMKAVLYVTLLVASGFALSAAQLRSVSALFGTGYGQKLLVKLLLFAVLLAMAAVNKFVFTPQLEQGNAAGARGLRRSIVVEYILYVVILMMAASLTLSVPPRAL